MLLIFTSKRGNPEPRVSRFGMAALKTLAILRTDEPNPIQSYTHKVVTCPIPNHDIPTATRPHGTPKQAKISGKNKQPRITTTFSHTISATLHCSMIPHSTVWYITGELGNAAHQLEAPEKKQGPMLHASRHAAHCSKCSMLR